MKGQFTTMVQKKEAPWGLFLLVLDQMPGLGESPLPAPMLSATSEIGLQLGSFMTFSFLFLGIQGFL